MSGEDVKAKAQPATGSGTAHGGEAWQTYPASVRVIRADGVARGLTVPLIREAAQRVRVNVDGQPSRGKVATELHISESTLKRAMKDLGMAGWPPSPPDD